MNVTLAKARDGRRPYADQRLTIVGRIALKIAPQTMCVGGDGKAVFRPCKMIDPDGLETGGLELRSSAFSQPVAQNLVRQRGFIDQLLPFRHMWHMGIAKQGYPLWAKRQNLRNCCRHRIQILMW